MCDEGAGKVTAWMLGNLSSGGGFHVPGICVLLAVEGCLCSFLLLDPKVLPRGSEGASEGLTQLWMIPMGMLYEREHAGSAEKMKKMQTIRNGEGTPKNKD